MTAPTPSTPEEFACAVWWAYESESWPEGAEEILHPTATALIALHDAALLAPLREEVERLREALRPFAEFGAVVGGNARDHVCGMYVAVGKRRDLHVSDFRAAARALAEGQP